MAVGLGVIPSEIFDLGHDRQAAISASIQFVTIAVGHMQFVVTTVRPASANCVDTARNSIK